MQALAQQSMLSDCRYCRYYLLLSLEVLARSRKSTSRDLPPGEEPQDAFALSLFDTSDEWRQLRKDLWPESLLDWKGQPAAQVALAMQQLAISNKQLATASF